MPFVSEANGKIQSIKLEFNLAEHCNYSCAECSHLSPYMRPRLAALESFERDLRALAAVYHVRRFRFVGGEPLLHKEILRFVAAVRSSGIADEIQICTNGSLLARADDAVLDAIDRLSVSWYPDPRLDEAGVEAIRRRASARGLKLKVERIDSFRAMNLDEDLPSETQNDVFKSCLIAHSWYCQTFYEGRFYLCSRPLFTAPWVRARGGAPPDYRALDGLDLHAPALLPRLRAYLARTEPLEACKRCAGTVGERRPWAAVDLAERKAPAAPAGTRLSQRRLRYLLVWSAAERQILKVKPSLRVARALQLVKNLAIRD